MRQNFLRLAAILAATIAAGCAPETPAPTPTPLPTPAVLTIELASELFPMRPALAACAAEIGNTGLLVFEAPEPALPGDADSVTLRLGYPAGFDGQASLLGEVEIMVTAGAQGQELTKEGVLALFSGEAGAPAGFEAWIPLPGTESRRLLDEWMDGTAYSPDGFLAPGPQQMLEALTTEPGAIGVLPSTWAAQDLQALFSLGKTPLLALTQDEPAGKLREWIGCLQGENPGS